MKSCDWVVALQELCQWYSITPKVCPFLPNHKPSTKKINKGLGLPGMVMNCLLKFTWLVICKTDNLVGHYTPKTPNRCCYITKNSFLSNTSNQKIAQDILNLLFHVQYCWCDNCILPECIIPMFFTMAQGTQQLGHAWCHVGCKMILGTLE